MRPASENPAAVWKAWLASFSIAQSEPNSVKPLDRAHASASRTKASATPVRRTSGSTQIPRGRPRASCRSPRQTSWCRALQSRRADPLGPRHPGARPPSAPPPNAPPPNAPPPGSLRREEVPPATCRPQLPSNPARALGASAPVRRGRTGVGVGSRSSVQSDTVGSDMMPFSYRSGSASIRPDDGSRARSFTGTGRS